MSLSFSKGERLTASKMNDLASLALQGNISGESVNKSSSQGSRLSRNATDYSIPPFVPLGVEKLTKSSLIVRGGIWSYYIGDARTDVELTVDGGGTSSDPADFVTLSPTLSASTSYTAYLELDISTDTLTAACVATSSFPSDEADKRRYKLAIFETDADSYIRNLDPLNGDLITTESGAMLDDIVVYEHSQGVYLPTKPLTRAGSYWHLVAVEPAGETWSGQLVPDGKRYFFMEQFCLPLYDVPGYTPYTSESGESFTFIDGNGDTQTVSATDGVLGSFTGTLNAIEQSSGDSVAISFTNGVASGYDGVVELLINTSGDSLLVRIDSDGKVAR